MRSQIPDVEAIIREAHARIRAGQPILLDESHVRRNFSVAVETVYATAYEIYQEHERRVIADLTRIPLESTGKDNYTKDEVEAMLRNVVQRAITTEIHLKQSRSARAGRTFEVVVRDLLALIGIRSERMTGEDRRSGLRRIDLVIPDRRTAIERPDAAHFLSLKTSLKDRWKLVVEDQRPNQRTHLITLLQREKLTDNVAEKIISRGIFIYIPDSVKDDCFLEDSRVRRISDLPEAVRS